MVAYSFVVLHENEKKPAREIQVGVTGQQFYWSYQYPPSVTGGAPINSYQLYLPDNESVEFNMRSKDVIHAFWIPAFRLQEDVVPGITTHYRATPDRLGSYPVVCNLLCGVGHSLMRSTVHVVTPAQFRAWISQPAARARAASSSHGRRRHRLNSRRGYRIMSVNAMIGSRGDTLMAAKFRAPGFYRASWLMVLGVAFATALTWLVRMSTGHATFDHFLSGEAILTVSLIAVPLAFLVGIGGFDYWFYWAIGRPTRPEDHSGHGAYTWKDYFRINTDHKVIGIQYTVNSFFFLLIGGLLAMLMRAQLAQPGSHFVSANTYNGLFSVHASLLIFLFIIPVFAGLGNFVIPLMIGAPDMAFPRLNALSFWLLPVAGDDDGRQLPGPRRRVRGRLDRVHAAVDRRSDRADVLLDRACSSRAPPRS